MDRLLIICLSLSCFLHDARGQGLVDSVNPQAVVIEPATPAAISVRWPMVGDRNLNATVAVAFRKSGSAEWSHGYPLFRTFNERLSPDNVVPGGHLFAGSVVGLEPATDYALRLDLHDPDG